MGSISRNLAYVVIGFLLGTMVARSGLHLPLTRSSGQGQTFQVVGPPAGPLLSDEQNTVDIFRSMGDSVVFVASANLEYDPFSDQTSEVPQGSGSGFVWDADGHIVTNYHVAGSGSRLVVRLSDGSEYAVDEAVGHRDKDIAVLHVSAPPGVLKPLSVGESRNLVVGQKVIAIGNPFGLDKTLTTGVVSALGRRIQSLSGRTIYDVIQTDAAINPGNSGGPLLDSHGQLIGMNTMIYSNTGSNTGIGFAVPVDTIKRVVPSLIQKGEYHRAGIGVRLFPDETARQRGVNDGVVIGRVISGSPAERIGLQPSALTARGAIKRIGDVIIAVDDVRTPTVEDLQRAIDLHEAGDEVTIRYRRDGKELSSRVKLDVLPEERNQ